MALASAATAPAKTVAETKPKTTTAPAAPKKPRSKLPELDVAAITEVVAVTTPDTMHTLRPQRAERTPQQQKIDAMVKSAYDSWVKVGSPDSAGAGKDWTVNTPHGVKLGVKIEQLESLKAAIRKGADHLNLRARFGLTVTNAGVAQFMFIVTDKPSKDETE